MAFFTQLYGLNRGKMSESKFKCKLKKKIEDVFDVGTEGAVSIIGELTGKSLFGTFAPRLTTAFFSYKQKRFEKNINKAIDELKKRETELNERLSAVVFCNRKVQRNAIKNAEVCHPFNSFSTMRGTVYSSRHEKR